MDKRTPIDRILPPHGGYENLASFQKSAIVYRGTAFFCERFVSKRSRTYDQMVQAARSAKQNIVEGSVVSGTSKSSELRLTNVARASLEELRQDFSDFLVQKGAGEWPATHPWRLRLQELNRQQGHTYEGLQQAIEQDNPVIAANVMIGLIRITCFLLDRQIASLEKAFLEKGGIREQMHHSRTLRRRQQKLQDARRWEKGTG